MEEEEFIDNSTITLSDSENSWIFCVTWVYGLSLVSCFKTELTPDAELQELASTFSAIFMSDFKEKEAEKFIEFDEDDEDDVKQFDKSIRRSLNRCFKKSKFTYVKVEEVPELVFLEFDILMKEYERSLDNEEIDNKTLN